MHLLTAYQLNEKFRKGEVSSKDIVEYFLKRIECIDDKMKKALLPRLFNRKRLSFPSVHQSIYRSTHNNLKFPNI